MKNIKIVKEYNNVDSYKSNKTKRSFKNEHFK